MRNKELKALNHLKQAVTNNLGLKLLSLALALILSNVSRQPTVEIRVSDIPVEFRGVPARHEIVGTLNPTVSIRIRGPENIIRGLNPGQISVVADIGEKEAGDSVVPLHPEDVVGPDQIQVLEIVPRNIRLHIEKTETRTVPLRAMTAGEVLPGFELLSTRVIPPTIEIEGPRSEFEESKEVATERVNIENKSSSFEAPVDVEMPSPSLRRRGNEKIRVAVEIVQKRVKRRLTKIPVLWTDRSTGDFLITQHVDLEIIGPQAIVESITDSEVQVRISTSGLPEVTRLAVPVVTLPQRAIRDVGITGIFPPQIRFKRSASR